MHAVSELQFILRFFFLFFFLHRVYTILQHVPFAVTSSVIPPITLSHHSSLRPFVYNNIVFLPDIYTRFSSVQRLLARQYPFYIRYRVILFICLYFPNGEKPFFRKLKSDIRCVPVHARSDEFFSTTISMKHNIIHSCSQIHFDVYLLLLLLLYSDYFVHFVLIMFRALYNFLQYPKFTT